jgi:hypothetical protein
MSIRLAGNYGNVVEISGACYHLAGGQPTLGSPNKSLGEGDRLYLGPQTFSVADEAFGDTWSACQMCVATMGVHSASSVHIPHGEPSVFFTAPKRGIMRINVSVGSGGGVTIYINTVPVWGHGPGSVTRYPISLNSGDVVSINKNSSFSSASSSGFIFCPRVWP